MNHQSMTCRKTEPFLITIWLSSSNWFILSNNSYLPFFSFSSSSTAAMRCLFKNKISKYTTKTIQYNQWVINFPEYETKTNGIQICLLCWASLKRFHISLCLDSFSPRFSCKVTNYIMQANHRRLTYFKPKKSTWEFSNSSCPSDLEWTKSSSVKEKKKIIFCREIKKKVHSR